VSFTPSHHSEHTNGILTLDTAPLRISSTNPQQQASPIFTHRHISHTHSPHTGPPKINHKNSLKATRPTEQEEFPSKPTPKLNTRTSNWPSQRSKEPAWNSAKFTCFRFSVPIFLCQFLSST